MIKEASKKQEIEIGDCLDREARKALVAGSMSLEVKRRAVKHIENCQHCYSAIYHIIEEQSTSESHSKSKKARQKRLKRLGYKRNWNRILRYAAVFLLILNVVALFFYNRSNTNTHVDFEPYRFTKEEKAIKMATADPTLRMAMDYYEAGKFMHAISSFEAIKYHHPFEEQVHFLSANVYMYLNEWETALVILDYMERQKNWTKYTTQRLDYKVTATKYAERNKKKGRNKKFFGKLLQ